jgi:hypothetical protein
VGVPVTLETIILTYEASLQQRPANRSWFATVRVPSMIEAVAVVMGLSCIAIFVAFAVEAYLIAKM